ncbi:MAG: gliding motility-associated-like protein [bacterium]|jgi:gliding motility-associated-like protein
MKKCRLCFVLVVLSAILGFAPLAEAQPCYSGFTYRVPIAIDNSKSALLEEYEIKISINSAALISTGKMRSLGQDIRFLDKQGNELNYWIKDGTINTSSTTIWVQADSIQNYSKDTIYLYYGNGSAGAKSDSKATFQLVEEFNGSTLSSSLWGSCGSGTVGLSGGKLRLTSNSTTASIYAKSSINGPIIVELEGVSTSGGTAVVGQLNNSDKGYAMVHDGTNMQLATLSGGTSCIATTGYGSTNTTGVTGDWTFVWSGSSQEATWAGQTLTSANTTYTMSNQSRITIANIGTYGTLNIDYLRIRKYASIEPGISVGGEQNMNYNLTATYSSPLCAGGDLQLSVNTVAGAMYKWTGPNSFKSILQNPQITGVSTSDAGRYDLTVEIPSGCASKSTSVNVNVSPKAVGGTVSGTQTVCSGSNTGVISLSGQTGNVVRWDSASSSTGPWKSIANTSLNQTYNNLVTTTYFRAIVGNGNCSIDSSSVAAITVTPPSKGGSVSGATGVCAGSNSGTVTVSSHIGNVLKWQFSTNGNLWNNIVNKGTTQSYTNLSQTTYYRAVVQNGNCNIAYSNPAKVTVDATTVGGSTSGTVTVCPEGNSGYVILNGNVGDVTRWEMTSPGSSLWTKIMNTSDSLWYKDLTKSTVYRAVVQNGACNIEVSGNETVTVLSKSNAGTIIGAKEVCETGNSGRLTLNGITGNILKWQSQSNGGSWTDIYSTKATHDWYNLADTTTYRVVVSNSGCNSDTSSTTTVLVNPRSDGGYISGVDAVCAGTNTATLNAKALVGGVAEWQTSTNGYAPWVSMSSSASTTYDISNLTNTTYYRTKVKSGVCAAEYSATKSVEATKVSNAGTVVKNLELCEGINFGVIKVTGTTGSVVKWQSTGSATGTWSNENITTTTFEVQNISSNLYLRAIIKNGVCSADTSKVAIVEVSKKSNAGNIYGNDQWCSEINAGILELKDLTGDVLYWEESETEGATWNKVVTNSTTYYYKNISSSTQYRAVVRNGVCSDATSQIVKVDISEVSKSGTLVSDQNEVCQAINIGTIQLMDYKGDIVDWERYSRVKDQWISAQNQGDRQGFYNITEPLIYRAIVKNNFCDADTSESIMIAVSTISVGGTLSGDIEACQGIGFSELTVHDYTGETIIWQKSQSSLGPWNDLTEKSDKLRIENKGASAFYRVKVKSGVCASNNSNMLLHTIYKPTISGEIIGGGDICNGGNNGVLELIGYNGKVLDWEQLKEDGSWEPIGFDGDLYWYENIKTSTAFRAFVQNGTCAADYSASESIEVHPLPQVGFDSDNLCEDQLASFTNTSFVSEGSIKDVNWIFSDGFTTVEQAFDKVFQLPGKFYVNLTATTDMGCKKSITKDIAIGETPKALFRINNGVSPQTGCKDAIVQFEDLTVFSSPSDLDYSWDFDNGQTVSGANPEMLFTKSRNNRIKLTVSTRSNCIDSYTADYLVLDEIKPKVGEDIVTSLGIGTQLHATGSVSYQWEPAQFLTNPAIANPIATVTENTQFVVTGTDYYGCKSRDSIWVNVTEDYRIIPNNVITPDGNNENDVWVVRNLENYPNNQVTVFDRWGREVYGQAGYANDWGATNYSGHLLMDGTYYYVIEFPETGKVMKGAITVVRNK